MVPKSKEFCSFHGEKPAQVHWDEILGLAPWKSNSEAFETFPQTSSAVPTTEIPSKTPRTSKPAQLYDLNTWMGKTPSLLFITCTESQIFLKYI